jgi:uncharacterized protein YigA (DUF484 family)
MPPENPPTHPPIAPHPSGPNAAEGNANRSPDAEAVARFLLDHPSFLEDNPELLSSMQLSHQSGGRTVSLMERQVDVLRQRYKALELRLADLLRHGEENDAITNRLHQWTRPLLLVRDPADLPDRITQGLHERFSVPQVALRLWDVGATNPSLAGRDWAEPVEASIQAWADANRTPHCGPRTDQGAAAWFEDRGASTRSMAMMSLRVGASAHAFGLLVLGSADVNRFDPGMGTAFLERIAEIASAALSRLVVAPH